MKLSYKCKEAKIPDNESLRKAQCLEITLQEEIEVTSSITRRTVKSNTVFVHCPTCGELTEYDENSNQMLLNPTAVLDVSKNDRIWITNMLFIDKRKGLF